MLAAGLLCALALLTACAVHLVRVSRRTRDGQRLDAARATWRNGFQARVDALTFAAFAANDTPTPVCDGDDSGTWRLGVVGPEDVVGGPAVGEQRGAAAKGGEG